MASKGKVTMYNHAFLDQTDLFVRLSRYDPFAALIGWRALLWNMRDDQYQVGPEILKEAFDSQKTAMQ